MTQTPTATKSERFPKGSFPPFISLNEAFRLVRQIYEQGGGLVSRGLFSKISGNSSSSSSFTKKIAALRSYGLVTEQNDDLVLTEQGSAIAAPTDERVEMNARKASLSNISVFSRIFERHKGKLLPADEFLKNIIEQEAGIPRELSSQWVDAFKESARAAGVFFDRPDGKTQIMELPILEGLPLPPEAAAPNGTVQQRAPSLSESQAENARSMGTFSTLGSPAASGNVTRFELSGGRSATFEIPFEITPNDARRLKSYLRGLELIIDAAQRDVPEDSQTRVKKDEEEPR